MFISMQKYTTVISTTERKLNLLLFLMQGSSNGFLPPEAKKKKIIVDKLDIIRAYRDEMRPHSLHITFFEKLSGVRVDELGTVTLQSATEWVQNPILRLRKHVTGDTVP